MRVIPRLVAIFLACSLVSCFQSACTVEATPGYSGPYPSAAAQQALHAIAGKTIVSDSLGLHGEALVVSAFGVAPNPVTGKGPVVILRQQGAVPTPHDPNAPQGADGRWYLPVLTDGDAADLVWRATGETPHDFGGSTSSVYRATLGLEER